MKKAECIALLFCSETVKRLNLQFSQTDKINIVHNSDMQGSEKPVLKKSQTTVFFGFYWVLGFIGFFGFYLKEQLVSLLVELAHQLSYYLGLPVL